MFLFLKIIARKTATDFSNFHFPSYVEFLYTKQVTVIKALRLIHNFTTNKPNSQIKSVLHISYEEKIWFTIKHATLNLHKIWKENILLVWHFPFFHSLSRRPDNLLRSLPRFYHFLSVNLNFLQLNFCGIDKVN